MLVRIKFGRGLTSSLKLAKWGDRWHEEEGQSLVEMAMSLTILLTFVFAVWEIGFGLYSYHFVSEAAREGTRYAMVRGSSLGTNCAAPGPPTCIAQSADIQTYVKDLGFPGINPTLMTVTPSWAGYPTGTTCSPSAACNNPGNLVTVKVQYNFPLNVPFLPAHTYSLSSQSAMIIAQ
jgi:Flp pilus assembly protein TadG